MASVASQLIEEVTAHAQSDSLVDVREICADGTYFPNNVRSLGTAPVFKTTLDLDETFVLHNLYPKNYSLEVGVQRVVKRQILTIISD